MIDSSQLQAMQGQGGPQGGGPPGATQGPGPATGTMDPALLMALMKKKHGKHGRAKGRAKKHGHKR